MMTLLAMPPGDMSSCVAILLVVGPRLTGVLGEFVREEIEAVMRHVVGSGLTGASTTMEVEVVVVPGVLATASFLAPPFLAPPFLDFLEAGCFEVPASPFLFLHNSNVIKSLCKANARGKKGPARTLTHFDLAANEGGNSAPSSVSGSKHPFSICPNCKHLLH